MRGFRLLNTTFTRRQFSVGEAAKTFGETYSKPLAALHWIGAIGIGFCVGSALVAQGIPTDKTDPDYDEEKAQFRGKVMHLHESVGLLMLGAMVPRVAVRLTSKLPKQLPASNVLESLASKASHGFLYFALIFMPVSGLAFGYFSCWGVPFFAWNVPGAPKEMETDKTYKALEGFFYENHHRVGKILTYVLPVHVGAVGFHHLFKGHQQLQRMLPWLSKAKQ